MLYIMLLALPTAAFPPSLSLCSLPSLSPLPHSLPPSLPPSLSLSMEYLKLMPCYISGLVIHNVTEFHAKWKQQWKKKG